MSLSDPYVARLLNEAFVPVRFSMWFDGPAMDPFGRDFVFRDGFFPFPGLILVDPELQVIGRTLSDASVKQTVRALHSALARRPDLTQTGLDTFRPLLATSDPAQAAFATIERSYHAAPKDRRQQFIGTLQRWLAEHGEALPDIAALALTLLGDCYYAGRQFREAEAAWQKVVDEYPDHPIRHRCAFNLKDKLSWPEAIHPSLQGLQLPGVDIHAPEVPYPELRAQNLARVAADPSVVRSPTGHLFARIPAGTFTMGAVAEPVVHKNERPLRRVTLSQPYLMGLWPVTRAQWRAFLPSAWPGIEAEGLAADLPHVRVTWDEAVAYCEWLTEHGEGWRYRLPTEAEWEYAARGGLEGKRFPWGDAPLDPSRANYSLPRPVPVGSYAPNAWGIFEALGNVGEYCSDMYRPDAYALTPPEVADPAGPTAEQQPQGFRTVRGCVTGSEFGSVIAHISWRGPCGVRRLIGGFGFRLVAEPPNAV